MRLFGHLGELRKFLGNGILALFVITSLTIGETALRANEVEQARILIQEWIQTEKQISLEKNDWEVERETLQDLIALLQGELKQIAEENARVSEVQSQADAKRAELMESNRLFSEVMDKLAALLPQLESRLQNLYARCPVPLQKTLEPFVRKIPAAGSESELPVSHRLQNLMGILLEVDKFNSQITLSSRVVSFSGGNSVAVEILYFGLAAGYFVDAADERAGVLRPSSRGEWDVVEEATLAVDIRTAIDIHKKGKKAAFVNLPVSVE